jgi:hypothetical protein
VNKLATFTLDGYNSYSGCDIVVTASLPLINGQSVGKYYTLGSIQTLSISTHQDKRPVRSLGVINAKDYVMGPRTIAGSMVFAVFNKHFATEIMKDLGTVLLPDEIPALDITISFANEYGKKSRMAIYGVKLINEGQVMSINDLYTENTYQFVALGLEPLNVETDSALFNGSNLGNDGDLFFTSDGADGSGYYNVEDFNNNSGSNVSDSIKNNPELDSGKLLDNNIIYDGDESVFLQVSVQNAYEDEDMGLATFYMLPEQKDGMIYIYEGDEKKEGDPDYGLPVNDIKENYSISLYRGKYTAQYVEETTSKYSNIVTFVVETQKYEMSRGTKINVVPFIEKVTDKTITVSLDSKEFDTIHYFKRGGAVASMLFEKSPITLENLEPNTVYWIYFGNSIENSKNSVGKKTEPITVKTFKEDITEADYFRAYVEDNSNLLINDKDEVLNTIDELEGKVPDDLLQQADSNEAVVSDVQVKFPNKFVKSKTLIDAILSLPDSAIKQELLIFANKLTYQLISSYNSTAEHHISENISRNPFSAQISLKDYDKAFVYEYNNKKSYLINTFDCLTESFYGKSNKHYNVVGSKFETNKKSIPRFFSICKNTYMDKLIKYTNTNAYENLDLSSNLIRYHRYDSKTILALTIKENCYCDLNVLPAPYVYISDTNKVMANVKYDFINAHNIYNLVCAELNEALDYTPFRKVKFNGFMDSINLEEHYLGLVPGNKYLFWIEDNDNMKLSKPFLFEYTLNDTTLKEIYRDDVNRILDRLKREMLNKYSNNFMLEELFQYIRSIEPPEKDLYSTLESELITYCGNSKYEIMTYDMLFELMKITQTQNRMNILFDITIDKKNRNINFKVPDGYYMCAIKYTEDGSEKVHCWENTLNYGGDGYVLLFVMSNNMLYKSGFVLIDCKNNRYLAVDGLVEYISEGDVN